jgi:hypothetical protein
MKATLFDKNIFELFFEPLKDKNMRINGEAEKISSGKGSFGK